jgi:murein DD-endopeptidase MepM/ murein hydrolase activator NlpD
MRRKTARKKRTTAYPPLASAGAGRPARRGGGWVALVLGALVVVNLYVFVWDKKTSVGAIKREAAAASKAPVAAIPSQPLDAPDGAVGPASVGAPGASALAPAPVGPPGTIDGKVAKADTLGRLLKRSGLSAGETDEVIRSLSGVLDFKSIRAGQSYRIERGPDGRVKLFELVVSKVQTVRSERAPSGELVAKTDTSQTRIETRTLGGRIDSSLYASLKGAGETAALVDFFVDVFAYDLDFYNDTHEGDTFKVVVEKEFKDAEFLRYRKILAAEYRGKAGTFRTFAWNNAYYDPDGTSAEKSLLKTPLKFQRVSSGFDRKRMHPVLHTARAHLGIDYAAPTGTPVWAAASGTITHRGPAGGAGNLVMIRHESGVETAYMHLSKFAGDFKVGQRIAAKTVIGYVGTTGLSTGPHLHFGVKQNGVYIDPTKLAPMRGKGVPRSEIDAFKAEVGKLESLLGGIAITPAASAPT